MQRADRLKRIQNEQRIKKVDRKTVDLPVGGAEGRKTSLSYLFQSLKETFGWKRKVSELISKEYKIKHLSRVRGIVSMYRILKQKGGYIIPEKVSYRIDEKKGVIELLMSDMRRGGKRLVWGYSAMMSPYQFEVLKLMKIDKKAMVQIEEALRQLIEKATRDKFCLEYYYFHILKDIESGEFLVGLLDIDSLNIMTEFEPGEAIERNKESAQIFLSQLREHAHYRS